MRGASLKAIPKLGNLFACSSRHRDFWWSRVYCGKLKRQYFWHGSHHEKMVDHLMHFELVQCLKIHQNVSIYNIAKWLRITPKLVILVGTFFLNDRFLGIFNHCDPVMWWKKYHLRKCCSPRCMSRQRVETTWRKCWSQLQKPWPINFKTDKYDDIHAHFHFGIRRRNQN